MNLMPHGWCMNWDPWLVTLNVAADLLVAGAYYCIPVVLLYSARRFHLAYSNIDPHFRPLVMLFALFIFFCGTGHIIDIVAIWKPVYWLKGFWNLGTGLISVLTLVVLMNVKPVK